MLTDEQVQQVMLAFAPQSGFEILLASDSTAPLLVMEVSPHSDGSAWTLSLYRDGRGFYSSTPEQFHLSNMGVDREVRRALKSLTFVQRKIVPVAGTSTEVSEEFSTLYVRT